MDDRKRGGIRMSRPLGSKNKAHNDNASITMRLSKGMIEEIRERAVAKNTSPSRITEELLEEALRR